MHLLSLRSKGLALMAWVGIPYLWARHVEKT